ncbi:MAG: AmmeMemoRadiSam system protein A [Epsilonproteobacteria bacterium]|nr:MAG: AmmeMemoRadiSam system protein A [Campylobacterota bacterium]
MLHKLLLKIARESIEEHLGTQHTIDHSTLLTHYPELKKEMATFVTLTLHGELRGCIGSIIPHRTLLQDVIHNASSAAFKDPRFNPLSRNEYLQSSIEISLLTPPQELIYQDTSDLKSKIRPKIDGVIIQKGGYSATFLPQVWEQLPTFELFFAHLGQKAGLGSDMLALHPKIEIYQVEHFEDKPLKGAEK